MPYWAWLAVLSAVFVLLERLRPWRPQRLDRPGVGTDVLYLVFNGHVLGVVIAAVAARVDPHVDELVVPVLGAGHVASWPLWLQALVALFALDLIEWCFHNLLHRVPFLWTFHKVHHSIEQMDWLGNMRFHWAEVVLYRVVEYVPLLLLGFDPAVLFGLTVFSTLMGHLSTRT